MDSKCTPEQLAYGKGYAAGKRRISRDEQVQVFWEAAFIAAVEPCFECSGWTIGNKKVGNTDMRMQLAGHVADAALNEWKKRF